jgi:hypothetical protein
MMFEECSEFHWQVVVIFFHVVEVVERLLQYKYLRKGNVKSEELRIKNIAAHLIQQSCAGEKIKNRF